MILNARGGNKLENRSKKMEKTTYEKLAAMNVNEHVEKKGKFSYLSWSWAVDALRKASPTATWEVIRFNGLPFLNTEVGYFVEVAVTVDGITLSQIHPVLDNNNRPIQAPNSFQINTSIQRCLVKAIALHGLGLYIYSGEDLPEDAESNVTPINPQAGKYSLDLSQLNKAAKDGYKSFTSAWSKLDKQTQDGLIANHEVELKQIKAAAEFQTA